MGLNLKDRVNCFSLVLYPESDTEQFDTLFEKVKSPEFYACKYYAILHDKDINEKTGELKKPHYHLLVKLENAITIEKIINSLLNERGTQKAIENEFSVVKSFKGMVRYLIHKDDADKHPYEMDQIITNDRNLSYYFNDNTIVENFKLITDLIKENNFKAMRDLIFYCVETNNIIAMQYIQDNAYLVNCLFRKSYKEVKEYESD